MAKAKKNKLAFPIGVIAGILAVIGLITVIKFTADTVKSITDNTAAKKEYEQMLTPVVMFDPDPFDDLTQADVSQLLNSAVWALLMSEDGADKYPYSEGENIGIIVPQADIEQYFVSLFGTEIDIAAMHTTLDMSEYDITYDAALQSYILPITGIESAYTPKVYDIQKQGSSRILSVGYIGTKAWVQVADGEYSAPEPDKFMKITLRERDGGMYVSSIQATDVQEVIGTTEHREYIEEESTTLPAVSEAETTAPLTTAVPVTDEDGEEVTDENGETVTEYITVTEEATDSEETSTDEESTDGETEEYDEY